MISRVFSDPSYIFPKDFSGDSVPIFFLFPYPFFFVGIIGTTMEELHKLTALWFQ